MNASLPPCPRCSSRHLLARPQWSYAARTSRLRGVRCYIWDGGCSHATAFLKAGAPLPDGEEVVAVEARWAAHARQLFEETTERWTPAQRALHARTLGLELSPASPAQPEPKTDNEK